jgi:hypothetical protein
MKMKAAVLSSLVMVVLSMGMGQATSEKTEPKPSTPDTVVAKPAGKSEAASTDPEPAAAKPAAGAPAAKPGAQSDVIAVSGKIVETFNAGTYSYFLVEKEGKQTWVAVPTTEGKVGEEISFRPGMQMGKFTSTRLNRTFENIVFSVVKVGTEGTNQGDEFLKKKSHEATSAPKPLPDPNMDDEKSGTKPEVISGKVVETHNAGGYSYFALEKDGKKTWVAVTKMEGKVGDVMTFQPGSEMKNFKSKSLDRTFESIIFSEGPVLSGTTKQEAGALMKKAHENVKPDAPAKDGKPLDVKVEKAGGAKGYTVAELYEKSGALNGKEVVVTGKVVKVSKQIMGKNWVHLQDGSGDAATGNNNLVTTTQDVVVVGDVVTAQGKLAKDKDFGGGYQYVVIIEETILTKK